MRPAQIRNLVIVACVISVIAAFVGGRLLWRGSDSWWLRHGAVAAMAFWLAASSVPRASLSRFVRLAVLLPIGHLIALAITAACFAEHGLDGIEDGYYTSAVIEEFPLPVVLVVFAIAMIAVAIVVGRRRERLQALVTMTMTQLLVFGMWLPFAATSAASAMTRRTYCSHGCRDHWSPDNSFIDWIDDWYILQPRPALYLLVLLPPLVIAVAVTAVATWYPDWLRRQRVPVIALTGALMLLAVKSSVVASDRALLVQGAFAHVLLALVVLAIAALGVLGLAIWLRRRPRAKGRTWIAGVVTGDEDGDVVGRIEISSWLRGPRARLRPCMVSTAHGDIAIPGGTSLDANIPASTITLAIGESVVVLRTGERVLLGGLVEQRGDGDPFRSANTLAAGPATVIVPASGSGGFASMLLALWRPSVAYLAIVTAVAIPTLIAAFM